MGSRLGKGGSELDEAEARRIMAGGLGRAELEFATSVCAPLYWIIREADGRRRVRNGTAFFLDAGAGVFAVTAEHVLAGLEEDRRSRTVEAVQLGRDLTLDLDGRHAVIDRNHEIDIATFRISASEVEAQSNMAASAAAGRPKRLLFRLCRNGHAVALALGNLLRRRSRKRCGRRGWAKGYLDGVRPEPLDRRDGVGLAA